MSTRFDEIGSRTHEGGIGASLRNTLAPPTPSRSSIDWKGLPGDGEDEVGGRGEMEKERKERLREISHHDWGFKHYIHTCTMRKGLHTLFNLSVEDAAKTAYYHPAYLLTLQAYLLQILYFPNP